MPEESTLREPLIREVVAALFDSLANREDFDVATVTRLKRLAESGGLTQPDQVTLALRPLPEQEP